MFKMHCLYYIAINATNNCWLFFLFKADTKENVDQLSY